MKKICLILLAIFLPGVLWAQEAWEKDGDLYFLVKSRKYFSAQGAGENRFKSKFLNYDGIPFLVRGPADRKDYGRLDLSGDNIFNVPIEPGLRVEALHLLAGGSYSNSYKGDPLLALYGDNYYYSTITVVFAYEDGSFKSVSAPIFWDWFHLGKREWSSAGAKTKSLGDNPVRFKCNFYHLSFINPDPDKPLRALLVSDSWLRDMPFSDIFAVTLQAAK